MPNAPTTIAALETELATLFAAMAFMSEECFGQGAGHRLLNQEPTTAGFSHRQVQVRNTAIGKMLPVWHAYAFDGVALAGHNTSAWDNADGLLQRLGDLVGVFNPDDGYVLDCLHSVSDTGDASAVLGHLAVLHARVLARLALDNGEALTLKELAVLAEMNERSVRNAVHAEGDSRLSLGANDQVDNTEAARWLLGRRNFKPTERRAFPLAAAELPDTLLAPEIPAYLAARLQAVQAQWGEFSGKGQFNDDVLYEAHRRSGLAVDRLKAAMRLPLDIRPDECHALAKLLDLDTAWFTLQVMYALYPEQMDTIINPRHWAKPQAKAEPGTPDQRAVVVELSAAMLTHGYLDLPVDAAPMFAGAAFGSKGSGFEGTQVELRFGAHTAITDIRLKSAKTIAPRKRFSAWFNTELRAKPGDRIRVDKLSDGVFSLTYLPV